MNINKVASGNNDLSRFIDFINSIEEGDITVLKEDWDNMCGITVSNIFGANMNDSISFNFYEDGKFRALVQVSNKNQRKLYEIARDKEFKYASLWKILKIWWKAKQC